MSELLTRIAKLARMGVPGDFPAAEIKELDKLLASTLKNALTPEEAQEILEELYDDWKTAYPTALLLKLRAIVDALPTPTEQK